MDDTDENEKIAKAQGMTLQEYYDEYGDGFEFEPKYGGTIAKGTKIEIFKGPPKTETDIVAVSYGLRGNTTIASKKFVTSVSFEPKDIIL